MEQSRRIFLGSCWMAAGATMLPLKKLSAAEPRVDLSRVLPQLRSMAKSIAESDANSPPLSRATLAQTRARDLQNLLAPPADVPWVRKIIAGVSSQPDVVAYLINSQPRQLRPAVVHMHGGGFVTGSALQYLPSLQGLAKELDCVVLSVEYRLAPETTFVGSMEDNYAALKWLSAKAERLGVDAKRIAVMGESAGGGHAALLAINARDRGEVPVAFQCLIYPMLDDRTGSSRKVLSHVGTLMHTASKNRFCWEAFLGESPGTHTVPRKAVPARLADFSRLPPSFVGVGDLDLFVHEDIEYARRLVAAGVQTELIVVPGAFHVFDMAQAPISRWFTQAKLAALRRGLNMDDRESDIIS